MRLAIFGAMAALLVAALCVPEAFDDSALIFAGAYGVVRIAPDRAVRRRQPRRPCAAQVGHRARGGHGDRGRAARRGRRSRTAPRRVRSGRSRSLLDVGGPYFFGAEGWKLVPGHFAERHGLIVIIALGESIVAIGVGAEVGVDAGVVGRGGAGHRVAAALWWLYFDVVALVAARRLADAPVGREQNEMARDSYSYLHFPMVAGIVLLALGLKKTIGDVEEPLKLVPAAALLGGVALYLLAHVAFRFRNLHTLNRQRLAARCLLLALLPARGEVPSLATLGIVAALLAVAGRVRGDPLRRGAQRPAPAAAAPRLSGAGRTYTRPHGAWRSLVAHLLWEQGVAGSNPAAPIGPRSADRDGLAVAATMSCGRRSHRRPPSPHEMSSTSPSRASKVSR